MNYRLGSKILVAITLITIAVLFGVIGFMSIEDYNFLDALYMTIITISTVGFRELKPLSEEGKMFTIFLIATNIGIFTYSITTISSYLFDGELRKIYKRLKVKNRIENLKDHVIICGYGRNGKQASRDLKQGGIKHVIIEQDDQLVESLNLVDDLLALKGDATEDQILIEAGIDRARALVTTLPTDADNVFVVLTAKRMNPKLKIISRATKDSSEQKLRTAGASNVIMPEKIGGAHMASLVTKPDIMEFIDIITGQGDASLSVEELNYDVLKEEFKHQTLQRLDVRKKTGANVIGFKRSNGEYIINPPVDMTIEHDCKLILLGSEDQIAQIKEHFMK